MSHPPIVTSSPSSRDDDRADSRSAAGIPSEVPIRIVPHPTRPGVYQLAAERWLPAPIHDVFEFFSNPANLESLTPPWLHFRILTPPPIPMHTGTLIDYRIIFRWIPLRWRTEISVWEPPFRFVDQQLRGPYRLWHHEHIFVESNGGTLVRDQVNYSVYGGRLIHSLLVRSDLERIFNFRHQQLANFFPPP